MTPMTMDRDRFEELCAAYVLGALDPNEMAELRAALADANPEERRFFLELKRVASQLPAGVERAQPSPAVREKILGAVASSAAGPAAHASPTLSPAPTGDEGLFAGLASLLGFGRPRRGLTIAFALLLIAAGGWWTSAVYQRELLDRQREVAQLQENIAESRTRFTALTDELTRQTELLAVLQAPKIDVVIMKGLEVNPTGYGKIIWDPDRRRAILQISNLPAVPEGKDYQLWVIKAKQPINAGVFAVTDMKAQNFFKIEDLAETDRATIDAFAVTLEPKGGVPQPSGAMYLLGSPSPR